MNSLPLSRMAYVLVVCADVFHFRIVQFFDDVYIPELHQCDQPTFGTKNCSEIFKPTPNIMLLSADLSLLHMLKK